MENYQTTEYKDTLPVVYVSGPMSADNGWEWEKNIRAAEEMSFYLIGLGFSCVTPQTMGRVFKDTYSRTVWMDNDVTLLSRCDGILMMPGWKNSRGARDEFHYALEKGMPVYDCATLGKNRESILQWKEVLKGANNG